MIHFIKCAGCDAVSLTTTSATRLTECSITLLSHVKYLSYSQKLQPYRTLKSSKGCETLSLCFNTQTSCNMLITCQLKFNTGFSLHCFVFALLVFLWGRFLALFLLVGYHGSEGLVLSMPWKLWAFLSLSARVQFPWWITCGHNNRVPTQWASQLRPN